MGPASGRRSALSLPISTCSDHSLPTFITGSLPDRKQMSVGPENENMEEDLREIKGWLETQPHLPPNIPDDQLEQFITSCFHRTEIVKKTIDTYYTMKTRIPEFFGDRSLDSPGVRRICKQIQTCILPKRTEKGYTVMCSRLVKPEPGSGAKFVLEDAIKMFLMSVDTCLRVHPRPSKGMVFVYDNTGVSLALLATISLSTVKKYFAYVQEAMPVRLKSIHVINVTPVMTHVMALIRPFIRKDRLKYINLHTADKIRDMYEVVPEAILPKDYGGQEATMDELFEQTMKHIRANENWFKLDETLRIDEAKIKSKECKETFVSSFKKLEID